MSWTSAQKGKKPLRWWYHKILCEFWYAVDGSGRRYYRHLNIMVRKYNINLYGEHC